MAESSIDEPVSKLARVEDTEHLVQGSENGEVEGKGKGKEGKKGKGKGKGKKGKDPSMKFDLVLESVQHEYDEVYSYKFTSTDTKPLVYKAGQYGHLAAPVSGDAEPGGVRHMSFASRAEDGHYLFTMDLSSKSPYKQLFAAAKPGAKTSIFKFKGEFVVDPAEQKEVVFVAGGIGITPMRAMIMDIVAEKLPVSCSLLHVARTEHLYQKELQNYTNVPQFRTNRAGSADALGAAVKDKPDAWYYICGSQRFVDGMVQSLQDLRIPTDKIRIENFR